MKRLSIILWLTTVAFIFLPFMGTAQIVEPKSGGLYYLIHSSGNVLAEKSDGRAILETANENSDQRLQFVSDHAGYYWIKPKGEQKYMALSGSWNTYFITDSTTNNAKYAIEKVSGSYVRLKCKANGKYLGTDDVTSGSSIYSDKSGTEARHYWYLSEELTTPPVDTVRSVIDARAVYSKSFEGWGVSLCWWANMCGKWSDNKIDQIVDWLVSPNGLNYNIFRYNIGGGDDPLNRHCTPHHMASGKGIRAEMEGFKDSLNADYNWSRDAAQRKIMLKIKEKRPDAIFEAFSNSAPYYMTYSGCCSGNFNAADDNLKPEYYDEFAEYLVDVCKFYKDSFNIEFKTLEPFNESESNYWAANGGQEGCHFSTAAQINFIKVLAPVLKASGLNTVISASDETSTALAVNDFLAYAADDTALDLVGQWNTHTYSGTNLNRADLRALSTNYKKTLWMSETGAGGSGIQGNLSMAQKLMNDIRYLRPEAWVDWQYIEEGNDQWCLVRGSFAAQTYQKVKNYYVRQQFSQYIKIGSKFIYVPNDQLLAALNPEEDALIVVALNNSSAKAYHKIRMSGFETTESTIEATRTSATENNRTISNYTLKDSTLSLELPAYSVSTFVIPVESNSSSDFELQADVPYYVVSRAAGLMLQSDNGSLVVANYEYGDSTQVWELKASGNGYQLVNGAERRLTDTGSYFAEASTKAGTGQVYNFMNIGDQCYKILSNSTNKALDLEGANTAAGTRVGFWDYGNSPAASHRQWIFLEVPTADSIAVTPDDVHLQSSNTNEVHIYGAANQLIILQKKVERARVSVYTLSGIELLKQPVINTYTSIPLNRGSYIVKHIDDKGNRTIEKVMIP